eukprot:3129754-Rhodomonas_salina.1
MQVRRAQTSLASAHSERATLPAERLLSVQSHECASTCTDTHSPPRLPPPTSSESGTMSNGAQPTDLRPGWRDWSCAG